jgi:outer membrane protein OmpA-like peptidoglycan-associated protein
MRMKKLLRLAATLLLFLAAASPIQALEEGQKTFPKGLAQSYGGGIGLLRTASPIILPQSTFSILGHLRYWQQPDFLTTGLLAKRLETGAAASISVNDYWELYFGAYSSSHLLQNQIVGIDTLIQSVGDFTIGAKVGYAFTPIFYGGIELEGLFRTSRGSVGPEFPATGIGTALLMALDWTNIPEPKPIRLTLNFGYRRDNSDELLETPNGGDPSANFALGIPWDDDMFYWGFALEVPQKFTNIFLEYSSEQHKDFNGSSTVYDAAGVPEELSRKYIQNPARFTPGIRIFPTQSINIDLATEIGMPLFTDKAYYDIFGLDLMEEIMPNWVAHFGIGYTFYPPDPIIPTEGRIVGVAYDAVTKKPLRNTILTFPGSQFSSLITNKDGQYRTYLFEEGPVKVTALRSGYHSATSDVVVRAAADVRHDIYLSPQKAAGKLMAVIVDTSGQPVTHATLQFQNVSREPLKPSPENGLVDADLAPNVYTIVANAAGFQAKSLRIRIVDRKTTKLTITLTPEKQQGTLSGRIENIEGKPLAATVLIKELGTSVGSELASGQYNSAIAPGTYTIQASAAGYQQQEKVVIIEKDRITSANFVLEKLTLNGKISGRVIDAATGAGVFAVLSFPNGEKGNIATDPDSGAFVIELPAAKYQIKAGSTSHQSKLVEVLVKGDQTTDLEIVLQGYQKVKVTKEKIEITEKIAFRTGKAIIKIDSYPVLDEIATVLKSNPEFNIVVEGHTDSVGSASANRKLSMKRAEAVREYIISRGIKGERLKAIGYGEDKPIADNGTDEGRSKNRRVEFKITK